MTRFYFGMMSGMMMREMRTMCMPMSENNYDR